MNCTDCLAKPMTPVPLAGTPIPPAGRLADTASRAMRHLLDALDTLRRRQQMRRQMRALSRLDARQLKDIGLSFGEEGSLAAEIAGAAEVTRRQTLNHRPAPLY